MIAQIDIYSNEKLEELLSEYLEESVSDASIKFDCDFIPESLAYNAPRPEDSYPGRPSEVEYDRVYLDLDGNEIDLPDDVVERLSFLEEEVYDQCTVMTFG